jgi:hypothetical protein
MKEIENCNFQFEIYVPPAWFTWLIALICLAPLVFIVLLMC